MLDPTAGAWEIAALRLGAAQALLLRVAFAFLAAAILYRLLADPEAGIREAGGGAREVGRRLLFAAMAMATVLLLTQRSAATTPGNPGRAFERYVEGVVKA